MSKTQRSPHSSLSRAVTARPGQKRAFVAAFAPLLLLAGTCVYSYAQQTLSEKLRNSGATVSRGDADRIARNLCNEMTGGAPVQTRDTTLQFAYSKRRNEVIREWNVTCTTNQGEYLLRINAATGRVYAINHMDTCGEKDEAEASNVSAKTLPPGAGDEEPVLNRQEAEKRARQYLTLLGISPRDLTPMKEMSSPATSDRTEPQWNFTYRRNVPGLGERLLKISVNSKDGDLEDAWNPVYAL